MNIYYFMSPEEYYSILLVISSIFNSFLIKKPLLSRELQINFEKQRKKIFDLLLKNSPTTFKSLLSFEKWIASLEKVIQDEIRRMEREYEKKGGYIGIIYGIIGVYISYIIFKKYTFYGIIALMVIDPIAAVFGKGFGKNRVPITHKSIEGTLFATLFFTIVLMFLGLHPTKAIIISLLTSLVELFSIEDNLTIPLTSSFLIFFLDSQIFF